MEFLVPRTTDQGGLDVDAVEDVGSEAAKQLLNEVIGESFEWHATIAVQTLIELVGLVFPSSLLDLLVIWSF